MKDISMSEKSDHHILNFKSDWMSHSDNMTMRSEREVGEFPLANISITPEPISKLQKMYKTLIIKSTTKNCKYNLNSNENRNKIYKYLLVVRKI